MFEAKWLKFEWIAKIALLLFKVKYLKPNGWIARTAFGLQPAALGEFLTVSANSPEILSQVRYSNVQEFKCLDDKKVRG